jgi:hypothetical protein
MKKTIAAMVLMLFVAGTSTAFAHGYGGHYGGFHGGPHYRYHGGGYHHDGLGLAFGIAGGLLLGSALLYSLAPPPRTVVYGYPYGGYGYPYTTYRPGVVVRPPRVCVQDRTVTGEWQISRYDGRQVWVSFPYPVVRRYQVPCY